MKNIYCLFSFILLCFIFIFSHFSPNRVLANENFEANLSSTYTINELGNAQVTHQITLINNTPTLYVTQYAIKVNSGSLSHIGVEYNHKPLSPNVATLNNETSIGITFNDKVVGKGQQRVVQVSYQTPDLVEMTPTTLGVTVPKLTDPAAYDHYQVTLKTPKKFGPPTRTSPAIADQEENNEYFISHFNNLKGQGISVQFGESQAYKIDLTYHLQNDGQSAGIAQVALPPDTSWQRMHYLTIQPQPQSIHIDQDGNWIASFLIQGQKNLDVKAQAIATLTLEPQPEVPIVEPLPGHIRPLVFWEADDEQIKSLAQQYPSPIEIYNHVINTLQYNYPINQTIPIRKGAVQSLVQSDQAVCQEFTDLFIALVRANKIPARRLTGFAYTKNNKLKPSSLVDNVLHAWPEFYDSTINNWRPVDPTWEQTTGGADFFHQFDLNHIVFAINGLSSITPNPAGMSGADPNDITVAFTDSPNDLPTLSKLQTSLNPKTLSQIPIPGLLELALTNPTGKAMYQLKLQLMGSEVILGQPDLHALLPFQTVRLPVYVKPNCWFACSQHDLQLDINGQTYQLSIPSTSRIWVLPGIIGVAIIIIVITLFTGSVLVFKRKK